jgi:predicted DNA-binding ribbon-helix-helix protein
MKSPVAKRSIIVGGRKTSVSVEEAFWSGMKEISGARSMALSQLVSEIDANRNLGNLSSAIRQFVLEHFKSRAVAPIGELRPRAGHARELAESSLETR